MRARFLAVSLGLAVLAGTRLLSAQAPPPSAQQQARVTAGPLSVPITVREQYLGRSGTKIVVKFILSASKGELLSALQAAK